MLPVIPFGHCGWPAGPGRIAVAGAPSKAIAALAHSLPAVNSARRQGPAVRTAASSAAKSPPALGASAIRSTAATMGGRMPAISPAGCGLGEQSAGIKAGALLRPQRHPDRVRLGGARVAPGVRLIAPEVQCAPGFHLVGLPGHGELQPAAGDVDQFLARVLHRLGAAGGARLHRGPGPGEHEPSVWPGDAAEAYPLMRGVHLPVLVWRGKHGNVVLADLVFHEVGDRATERSGDLQQGSDGRHHTALFNLVYRCSRHVGALAELLQRQAHPLAEAEHLEADGTDYPLQLPGLPVARGLRVKAGRSLRAWCSAHQVSAALNDDRALTFWMAVASIVHDSLRILNVPSRLMGRGC